VDKWFAKRRFSRFFFRVTPLGIPRSKRDPYLIVEGEGLLARMHAGFQVRQNCTK
jgi:hypothetical protein